MSECAAVKRLLFAAVVLVVVVDAIVVVGAARADNRRPVAPADGAAISGYTVSDVRYRLDQSDATDVEQQPCDSHRPILAFEPDTP